MKRWCNRDNSYNPNTTAKTSNGKASRASQITEREERKEEKRKEKRPKCRKEAKFFLSWQNSETLVIHNIHIPIAHTHSCETKKDSSHMCRYGAAAGKKFVFIFQHVLFVFTIGMLTSAWVFRLILKLMLTFLHFSFRVDLDYCLVLSSEPHTVS